MKTSLTSRATVWGPLMAASAVAFLLAVVPARACVLCLPYPKESSADIIIKSDTVVFARENPARPFSYVPVETLKGRYNGDPVPLLLDSKTARQLQLDPTLTVVLAQDRPGGTWRSLGPAGAEYQAVLREIRRWEAPSKSLAGRAAFFGPYLQHEDRGLAELAFLEVARAPYATIRDLGTSVDRDGIYRMINDFFRVEWHALYILMLGTSDRLDDVAFVRGKLNAAAEYGLTINLGAYATAFIEMTGADGVGSLAEEYLASPAHSRDELLEILKALSTQGNSGRADLRPAIVEAYSQVLTQHPELAGYVANDLFDWNETGFAARMREILGADVGLDEASRLAVAIYLSGAEGQSTANTGLTPIPR